MSIAHRIYAGAVVSLALVATFAVTGATHTAAVASEQSAQVGTTNSANTLKVSPVRSDITIEPGSSRVVETILSNLTNEPIVVEALENDFVAADEHGNPSLLLDADQYAPSHSLKRFIEPIGQVTVPANESVIVEVKIVIPADASAGGYFGAVRFAPSVQGSGGQVNMSASVASLILLTVPGDLEERLGLTDFEVRQNNVASAYFGNGDNLQLFTRFNNTGNVQAAPFGKVSVLKGDTVVYEADFNEEDPRGVVLPDSARRWEVPLSDIDGFGKYTVSATFTYGTTNQTIEATKTFWVIPLTVVAIAAAILLLVVTIVTIAVRKYLGSEGRQRAKASSTRRGR